MYPLLWLIAYYAGHTSAQTYTSCNPLSEQCDPVPALSTLLITDFTQGSSQRYDPYLTSDQVFYSKDKGVEFQIASKGDAPTVESDFFIMFGRVELEAQAAEGVGVVSSMVLISDDLDEIDIEWVGGDYTTVQSNYFSKGDTSTYDRGAFHLLKDPQKKFHKYAIDWTKDRVKWFVDGQEVRQLSNKGDGYYPQSPMQLRFGAWAGGDEDNSEGTIEWAGGVTDYNQGPFSFYVRKMTVFDYSTGREYKYGDKTGSWMSVQAVDGEINGNLNDAGLFVNNYDSASIASDKPKNKSELGIPISFHEGTAFDLHKSAKTYPKTSFTGQNSPTLTFIEDQTQSFTSPSIETVSSVQGDTTFVITTTWDSEDADEGDMTFEFIDADDTSFAKTRQYLHEDDKLFVAMAESPDTEAKSNESSQKTLKRALLAMGIIAGGMTIM